MTNRRSHMPSDPARAAFVEQVRDIQQRTASQTDDRWLISWMVNNDERTVTYASEYGWPATLEAIAEALK